MGRHRKAEPSTPQGEAGSYVGWYRAPGRESTWETLVKSRISWNDCWLRLCAMVRQWHGATGDTMVLAGGQHPDQTPGGAQLYRYAGEALEKVEPATVKPKVHPWRRRAPRASRRTAK